MTFRNPMSVHEVGIALPTSGSGYATAAYNGAGAYTGTAIAQSPGRFLTFVICATSLTSVTRLGFHIQGTNDDLSGSPTWSNLKADPKVQEGRWPSISPTILGIAMGSARTPPDGPALTAEQQAIEARRLVRFAANLSLQFTVDLERQSYKHHRLAVNEVVGAAAPLFATYFKTGLVTNGSSHPYEVDKNLRRPVTGLTDAQWAQFLDDGVVPAITDDEALFVLNTFKPPLRPSGLSTAQWDRARNAIVEEGLKLQHYRDTIA